MNFRQIKAIENANKGRITKSCPLVPDTAGIYILTREENGFRYAYIGQSKHLLTRLAQHLSGYQHIDLSLKKHKLKSSDNPNGWDISFRCFDVDELDEKEKCYIKQYADAGYQLYNHTTGSQGEGKRAIGEGKSPKGYRQGVEQGYKNAQKEISNLFGKHLDYTTKKTPPTKLQEKAMEKFKAFISAE